MITAPPNPANSVIPGFITGSPRATAVPMYSWVVPILPYMEAQDMFNQWTMWPPTGTSQSGNAAVAFNDPNNYTSGQASNFTIGNTAIGVLRCPDDVTAQPNEGNLSYAVNGGFAPPNGRVLLSAVTVSNAGVTANVALLKVNV